MELARARNLPVIVVGDIDRGGVFAALFGTLALLEAADQALVSGFVINKFRGDRSLLTPGLADLTARTGRPVLGVVPYLARTWIDAEDAVVTGERSGPEAAGQRNGSLRVAVIRLPRISNFTDVDALALEPGVSVRFVTSADELAVRTWSSFPARRQRSPISPGCAAGASTRRSRAGPRPASRARHLRRLPDARDRHPRRGREHGGHGRRPGPAAGSDALRAGQDPAPSVRICGTGAGRRLRDQPRCGSRQRGRPWFTDKPDDTGTPLDGCRSGAVSGTLWHGIFENDAFRRSFLAETARLAGRDFAPAAGTGFAAARQAQFDALADAIGAGLDTAALLRLIERGPVPGLPVLRSAL